MNFATIGLQGLLSNIITALLLKSAYLLFCPILISYPYIYSIALISRLKLEYLLL